MFELADFVQGIQFLRGGQLNSSPIRQATMLLFQGNKVMGTYGR
jgi:hypothetical protein